MRRWWLSCLCIGVMCGCGSGAPGRCTGAGSVLRIESISLETFVRSDSARCTAKDLVQSREQLKHYTTVQRRKGL